MVHQSLALDRSPLVTPPGVGSPYTAHSLRGGGRDAVRMAHPAPGSPIHIGNWDDLRRRLFCPGSNDARATIILAAALPRHSLDDFQPRLHIHSIANHC